MPFATKLPGCARFIGVAALLLLPLTGWSDSFQRVTYDPGKDELVIVVNYRGTNPDHQFSLHWGDCRTHEDGQKEIVGDLLDQQWKDIAQANYRKTLQFSIADLNCRPAALTVRSAPRFFFTLRVPANPGATNQ